MTTRLIPSHQIGKVYRQKIRQGCHGHSDGCCAGLIGLAVGIFFILPSVLTSLVLQKGTPSFLMNLAEGGFRLLLFFLYVFGISFIKDIRRVFMYHGAEHKTINLL